MDISSSLFLPVIESLDVLKDEADVVFFDGGSNFQLAGRIIRARFPRITVVHGLEHVLSLVFVDISKIPVIHVSYFALYFDWVCSQHKFLAPQYTDTFLLQIYSAIEPAS